MRVALYHFSDLSALTTIEFPPAMLTSPAPAEWTVRVNADIVLTIRCIACLHWMPRENKHNPARTYTAMPADSSSAAAVMVGLGHSHPKIPPQLLPQAARAVREAMKMGDAC